MAFLQDNVSAEFGDMFKRTIRIRQKKNRNGAPEPSAATSAGLAKMKRSRENRSTLIVCLLTATLLILSVSAVLAIRWIVYLPQKSLEETQQRIALLREKSMFRKLSFPVLKPEDPDFLRWQFLRLCADEDYYEAQTFLSKTMQEKKFSEDLINPLVHHLFCARRFFYLLHNAGSAVNGIRFSCGTSGPWTLLSVRRSVIQAKSTGGEMLEMQIRNFSEEELSAYAEALAAGLGRRQELFSYLLLSADFTAAERLAKTEKEQNELRDLARAYLRGCLNNVTPAGLNRLRMLYGSLPAFRDAVSTGK